MAIQTIHLSARIMIYLLSSSLLLASCQNLSDQKKTREKADRFDTLATYMESHANFFHSGEFPAVVSAQQVYHNLDHNILAIDVRKAEDFRRGHVPGAVNVRPEKILDYFQNRITPDEYSAIFLFSADHQESMRVNAVLRILGYSNTYNVRWGMAGWNSRLAKDNWAKALSSHLSGKLTTKPVPKNEPGKYPVIYSNYEDPGKILYERAKELLATDYKNSLITADEVVNNPDKYYLINYWPNAIYNMGHLENAVCYDPPSALLTDTYLNTLPADKPIVLYCYSNSSTQAAAAWLALLGYNVYTIEYGANSFMYDFLQKHLGRGFFNMDGIRNLPLEKH